MSLEDVDALIIALHEGVFETPYWSTFLQGVRAQVGADYVSLTFRRFDQQLKDIFLLNSGGSTDGLDPEFLQPVLDRSRLPYDTLEPGRPYALSELVEPTDPRHADYIEYLGRRSIRYAFVVRIAEAEWGGGWLTIGRSNNDFEQCPRALLSRLAPHLGTAARTLASVERERSRAAIAAEAVRRLNFGWLTFDAHGAVAELDPEADRLFRSISGPTGVARGQPLSLKGPMRRELLRVVSAFAKDPTLPPRAIHLVDDPWIDMFVTPMRHRTLPRDPTPVAVGYVQGLPVNSTERCDQLIQLFSLTRREAEITLALSRGKTIAETSQSLGLTLETTRNYSKRIYAKTGARGQSDLVRLVLASVIAMT